MSDYSLAVQGAIYTALTSPAISGVSFVVDNPVTEPAASDFPFIQIGNSDFTPDDTDDGGGDGGLREFFDLHVWSRYRGQKEVKEIASTIYDRFHGATLTVTGRPSALSWVRNRLILDDPDGLTRHGIVTLEIDHRS